MKYLIGITGNMGTGKSTVLRMLRQQGAKTIDADEITHQVMGKGTPVWEAIVKAFGKDILNPDGEVDRGRLGKLVFPDMKALRRLEKIVHPAVDRVIWEGVERAKEKVVAIEAVRLVEAGAHKRMNSTWVVTCAPEVQRERLRAQGRLSEEEIESRLKAQGPLSRKLEVADVIIDNSGREQETWEQVKREWERIRRRIDADLN